VRFILRATRAGKEREREMYKARAFVFCMRGVFVGSSSTKLMKTLGVESVPSRTAF